MRKPAVKESSRKQPKARKPVVNSRSAGGIVIHQTDDGHQVLLAQNAFNNLWVLPKGHLEKNETPEEAAVREVQEETGVDAEIIKHLGHIYLYSHLKKVIIRKRVDIFLMELVGDPELDPRKFDPKEGHVSDAKWFDIEEARQKISYSNTRRMFDDVQKWLAKHDE